MSTLGFGDITFHTDLGRIFSIVVLISGMIFLLILLPFTFIEFFYAPWMNAQAATRAPRPGESGRLRSGVDHGSGSVGTQLRAPDGYSGGVGAAGMCSGVRRGKLRKMQAGQLLPWSRKPYGYLLDAERPGDPS